MTQRHGVRNTLGDLNNLLFEQLERLNDEGITGEKLQEEIKRAKAMSTVATKIISTGSLVLNARKTAYEQGIINRKSEPKQLPRMLQAEFLRE